jgi:CheY-like chemotaxis protein
VLVTSRQKLVLIIDDTPANIGVISRLLKDSFKTKVATNVLNVLLPKNAGRRDSRYRHGDPAKVQAERANEDGG